MLLISGIAVYSQTKFNPPATQAIPVTDTLHGVIITDAYPSQISYYPQCNTRYESKPHNP